MAWQRTEVTRVGVERRRVWVWVGSGAGRAWLVRVVQRCRSVVGPAGRLDGAAACAGLAWCFFVFFGGGLARRRAQLHCCSSCGRCGAVSSGRSRAAALVSAHLATAVQLASGGSKALGGVPRAAAGAISGGGGCHTSQVPLAQQCLVRAPGRQVGALVGKATGHFAGHNAHGAVQAGLHWEGWEGEHALQTSELEIGRQAGRQAEAAGRHAEAAGTQAGRGSHRA